MVKIHHYSETKFRSFPGQKQQSVILEMLVAIETNLQSRDMLTALIEHLLECVSWMETLPSGEQEITGFHMLYKLHPNLTSHAIQAIITPLINTYQQNRSVLQLGIRKYDSTFQREKRIPHSLNPVFVVLDNLRSAYNVGAIFRIAECFSLEAVYLCGITPTPDNKKVRITAMGTEQCVSWKHFSTTFEAIKSLRQQKAELVALETAKQSISLSEFNSQKPVALILGNEALGIDPDVLTLADTIVSIPVFGMKNSLNVSTAFAIAAYDITKKREI